MTLTKERDALTDNPGCVPVSDYADISIALSPFAEYMHDYFGRYSGAPYKVAAVLAVITDSDGRIRCTYVNGCEDLACAAAHVANECAFDVMEGRNA